MPVQGKIINVAGFPGWPSHFEGKVLKQLPLTKRELGFYKGFPGKVARFSDGTREIILRWVTDPTRKLHPAADCFKGIGYHIQPQPIKIDVQQNRWGSFVASKDNTTITIKERIHDMSGNKWTDVSSWYWASLFGNSHGPWWVITVAGNVEE